MNELQPILYQCAYCGESNEALIDPSGGSEQEYTEDCAICCRPNVLHITIPPDGTPSIDVTYEG